MNFEEIGQTLSELANSGDPVFAQAAHNVAELTQQAQTGELSKEELTELLLDMQRQLDIIQDMEQLAFKEKLHTVLTGLITIAAAV